VSGVEAPTGDPGYGGPLAGFAYAPVFVSLFERAERAPDVVAIAQADRELTYAELARDARAVAAFLLARGHRGPERIGVRVERSIEATTAMLGVLAAGLVYVPIDVRNPPERVEHMLRTSRIRTVLDAETMREAVAFDPGDAPLADVDPAADAYVIYTSGTTGTPRGVVGRHLQLAKQLHGWRQIGYDLDAPRTAVIASYGFDSSFLEHFLTFDGGGSLRVFEHEDIVDTDALARTIDRHGLEFAILSPALLGGVASWFESSGRPLPLTHLVSGGEPVPNDALRRFQALSPDLDIRVGYGTTECTVAVTTHRFDPGDSARYSPIGRPMPGYHVYLLDDEGAPVAPGEPGEIHVSGDVLTRGYDSNEEETRRRFVQNPFADAMRDEDRCEVMYRTGDLARFDERGALVFSARVDNQIQVQGLRVELGEVEAAVAKAFASEAHCAVLERSDGSKGIVAYVVDRDGSPVGACLVELGRLLPEYMIPSHLVRLDALPVSINDKIDKARLPVPTDEHLVARHKASAGEGATADDASATEAEAEIMRLAQELLEIEGAISPTDLLVDLGADSLRIVRLVLAVQRTYEVKLPVKEMKAVELSARSLAALVEERRGESIAPQAG
jgi:nonribosomal peptide synthetase CepB